jgi:NAD(P)H-quinone oxidoreductase subunit 5
MLVIVAVGAASTLSGKLLKSVRADSSVNWAVRRSARWGSWIMQAGLGSFGAAITHLVLHGFYKAYQFLASGEGIEHASPTAEESTTPMMSLPGVVVALLTGLAGGAVFAGLTGKGTGPVGGLVLTLLVVVLALHATRDLVRRQSLPTAVRYLAVPLVGLPAIALYAAVYAAITGLMRGLPVVTAPAEVTVVHGVVAAAFVAAYVAIETGAHRAAGGCTSRS